MGVSTIDLLELARLSTRDMACGWGAHLHMACGWGAHLHMACGWGAHLHARVGGAHTCTRVWVGRTPARACGWGAHLHARVGGAHTCTRVWVGRTPAHVCGRGTHNTHAHTFAPSRAYSLRNCQLAVKTNTIKLVKPHTHFSAYTLIFVEGGFPNIKLIQ